MKIKAFAQSWAVPKTADENYKNWFHNYRQILVLIIVKM